MDGIDAHLQRYPNSVVVLDVMGTADPAQLRAQLQVVEPDTEEVFFFTASVGALFGVRRRDGSRVAVKFHKPFQDGAYLDELQRVQAGLADTGYPAPRPLARLRRRANGNRLRARGPGLALGRSPRPARAPITASSKRAA